MATFLPALNACRSKMTRGEARFASRLHTNLGEDFYCWYDVATGGRKSRYPDFILLNADLGLLSLEVKDWKLGTIRHIDAHSATLAVEGRTRRVANPLEQARQCAYRIVQKLEADPELRRHAGRYEGKLSFPYGFGVVFPDIGSDDIATLGEEAERWHDLFPPHRAIYRDQMTESVDSDDFRARIEDFLDIRFGHPLTESMVDRVRWHMFPEIRIGSEKSLFDEATPVTAIPGAQIRAFDIEQEKRARQMGDGHRVVRGVAGSGKTQIVAFRCQYFAEGSPKPVLALYYNIATKALLRGALDARGVLDRVHVRHFHRWCAEQAREAGMRPGKDVVPAFIEALDAGRLDTNRYSAVMIDEGQDFDPEWIAAIVRFCAARDVPLLFVYDDAQSIYEKRTGLGFSLASVGLKAQGRTTVMKVNYRNTRHVQRLASLMLQRTLAAVERDGPPREATPREATHREEWLDPVGVGEAGERPRVVLCDGEADEAGRIPRWLRTLNGERGVPWRDTCLIVRSRKEAERWAGTLARGGIPAYGLSSSPETKEALDLAQDTVKITTPHSAKGLEFPRILIPRLCAYSGAGERAVEDARLLYVAMTRATRQLVMTAQRSTPLVSRMQALIEEIAATMEADTH